MSKLRFAHIGLGKCASTFLQNAWGGDPRYLPISSAIYAEAARKFASEGKEIPPFNQRLGGNEGPGQFAITSSESYLYGWNIDPKAAIKTIRKLYTNSNYVLSKIVDTSTIFIMVRDPTAWIRSAYRQGIKQGSSHTYQEFLDQYETWMELSLDLRLILETFKSGFDNVVVLSSDDLRSRPEWFWSQYENLLDCPRPVDPEARDIAANETMADEKIKRLMVFNKFKNVFKAFMANPGKYPEFGPVLKKEYDHFNKKFGDLNSDFTWIARRFFEFAEDSLSQELDKFLTTNDLFVGEVPDHTLARLKETFLIPLESIGSVSDEALARYDDALG